VSDLGDALGLPATADKAAVEEALIRASTRRKRKPITLPEVRAKRRRATAKQAQRKLKEYLP